MTTIENAIETENIMMITPALTKNQIAYQKRKALKIITAPAPAIKLVVEESDVEESDDDEVETCKGCGEVDGEEQYDGYCETCYGEKLGHHAPVADEEESDEEESDEEEVEEDEEVVLLKRLAELKEAKARKEAQGNIEELRNTLREHQQTLVLQASNHLLHLQQQLAQINEGVFDEELITEHLSKSKPASKSAPKAKGEKGVKKEPTYEGKGKKAGTGEARKKDIANLNAGKTDKVKYSKKVGDKTWSLMFEDRRDGGLAIVKDNKGVYDIPVFKEVGGMVGVSIKTKQEYIEWIKK